MTTVTCADCGKKFDPTDLEAKFVRLTHEETGAHKWLCWNCFDEFRDQGILEVPDDDRT